MTREAIRLALHDKGVVHVERLLDAPTIKSLIEAIEHCREHTGPHFRRLSPAREPVVESELFRWQDVPAIRALTTEGALPALAASVFDASEVVLFEDQWFYSAEGSNTPSPWHQDQPYHPLEPWFLTIWLPLDPVPPGCALKAVERSHKGPVYAPVEFSSNEATLASGAMTLEHVPDIDKAPADFPILIPEAAPGDAVLLDSRTLHAAGGYCASPFRRLSIRYAPVETVFARRPWPVATFWADHDVTKRLGERMAGRAFPILRP